ncbi:MAG TPA: cyclodeaminase/cyclohydrolase family protein [Spirochaetota bacterium]|nr:cyclodeaminase/cyclohydrolase family protein [Spirochaetota bacterium]
MEAFKNFCVDLGSNNPTPGGGAALALVLAFGASASEKALRFSPNDFTDEFLNIFLEVRDAGLKLSLDDQDAFRKWMEARKLPKQTDEEKKIREEKVNYYAKETILVPYQVAKLSVKLLEAILDFIPHSNKWLISDLGVGASCAKSAFESALFNIYINFPYLKDKELYIEIEHFIKENEEYVKKISESIYSQCMEVINSKKTS